MPDCLFCQSTILKVIDRTTAEAIPYVTIYVPARSTGTLTDATGLATLPADYAATDSFTLSCLNYRDTTLTLGQQARTRDTIEIRLTGREYTIATVDIVAGRIDYRPDRLGDKRRPTNAMYDLTILPPPGEIGKIIPVRHASIVDSLVVYVNEMEIDSFLLEVNFYDFALGWPGERLQSARIIRTVTQAANGSEYTIDLSDQDLRLTRDALVTLKGLRFPRDAAAPAALLLAARVGHGKGMERKTDGSWSDVYRTPALLLHIRR